MALETELLPRRGRGRGRRAAFERAADHLRATAVLEPQEHSEAPDLGDVDELDRIRAYTASIHYVLPKLLLVAIMLDRRIGNAGASDGGETTNRWYGVGPAESLPSGIARGTAKIPLLDPEQAEGRVGELFREIAERHAHPGVASFYRALGHWPEVLDSLWSSVRRDLGSRQRSERKTLVVRRAAALEEGLRDVVEPEPAMPELDTAEAEEMSAILSVFRFRLVPDLLLDVCRIRGALEGPGAPYRSPFSAAEEYG